MKRIFILYAATLGLAVISTNFLKAQSVSINTDGSPAHSSAILDIKSITKGMLSPRMTSVQRNAIGTPAPGLLVYDTDTNSFWFYNGTAWSNLSLSATPGWLLNGNAATNPATHFIGTTDMQPLHFKVNSIWAGEIKPGSENLFIGVHAGLGNTTGLSNTAFGTAALKNNAASGRNVAVGDSALYSHVGPTGGGNTAIGTHSMFSNTTAGGNTALGSYSLWGNTQGELNTAIGLNTLSNNITGNGNTAIGNRALQFNIFDNNTAVGSEAMRLNSYGGGNTAIGYFALRNNISASQNTAVGYQALSSQSFNPGNTYTNNTAVGFNALYSNQPTSETNGMDNTAIGLGALGSNTIGAYNTASGTEALYSNVNGFYNSAYGYQALYSNVSGSYNTVIGNSANNDVSSLSLNTIIGAGAHSSASNSVVIGYNSFTNTPNLALLGNPATAYTGGYTNWSNFSDGRFKKDMDENVRGLDFIMRLRPVTYHMDVRGLYNFWGISPYGKEESKSNSKSRVMTDDAISKKESIRMTGFVAQEVEKAAKETNFDFDGVMKPTHDKDHYRLAYGEFVVPLVKAVQEQQVMIAALQKTAANTKTENKIQTEQQAVIVQLQQQVSLLEKRLAALETKL